MSGEGRGMRDGSPSAAKERAALRADDRAILDALAHGPLSARELAERIRQRAFDRWAELYDYDIDWGTANEPVGARLCAISHATQQDGITSFAAYRLHARLPALERRGLVERIQIEGKRPMLWRSRV